MSLTYSATVFCDRCGNWIEGPGSGIKSNVGRQALKKAKAAKWSRKAGSVYQDLCPGCVEMLNAENKR